MLHLEYKAVFFFKRAGNKRFSSLGVLLAGLIAFNATYAQRPIFRHYSTPEGLSSTEAYMVMQDSQGYIWISTDHGVSRFDGYEFKTFTTDDGLNGNTVFGTYEDYRGRIWFFTFEAGLSYYKNGEIINFLKDTLMENWDGVSVPFSMHVNRGDTIWLGVRHTDYPRQYVKVFPDGTFVKDSVNSKEQSGFIRRFKDGGYFMSGYPLVEGQETLLNLIDESGKARALKAEICAPHFNYHTDFTSFLKPNGNILFVNNGVLREWEKDSVRELVRFKKSTNLGLLEDKKQNVWIALALGGVMVYRNGNFEQAPQVWLEDKLVSWITEDAEGGIWITTLDDGVYYTPSVEVLAMSNTEFFGKGRLLDFAGKGDTLLVIVKNGMAARLVYQSDSLPDILVKQLFSQNITGILWPERGNAYITGWHENKSQFGFLNQKDFTLKHYPSREDILSRIDSANIYMGPTGITSELDRQTSEELYEIRSTRMHNWRSMYRDKDDLWLGGMSRLWRYSISRDTLEIYKPEEELLKGRVTDIDKAGHCLLLATSGRGLVIVDSNEVWNISSRDGLPGTICNDICVDQKGDIWLSTNKGISRVSGLHKSARLFSIRNYDFLASTISQRVKKIYLMDSVVWALSDDGIIYFNYKNVGLSKPPPVYIHGFEVNHKEINGGNKKIFNWEENNIDISFAGLSYQSVKKLRYKYRMLGLDTAWNYTTQTNVIYPKLGAGRYEFQVYAQNTEGIWSTAKAKRKFIILAPWWKRRWFIISEIVIVFLILAGIGYFYWQRQRKKSETENKMNQLKLQALQAQMNPHFIFNVLGAIQSFIVAKDTVAAQEYLASFASLVRSTLNHSVKGWVPLEEEIRLLKIYLKLEEMRFELPFIYRFEIDERLDVNVVNIPTMLLQPFIENSIIHGISPAKKQGSLHISIKQQGGNLKCTITDNGVGRQRSNLKPNAEEKIHRSLGVNITDERIKLLKSKSDKEPPITYVDLKDERDNTSGTKVIVILPYKLIPSDSLKNK